MQGVLAVRNLFQYNCLITGCPGDFLRTSFVAFNRTVFCGYLRQVSASGIGQLHFCTRQFLRSVSVLAYLDDRNGRRCVLHDQSVVGFAFFQTNRFFNIAVCIHCKCHFLGLFRKAVRCSGFFQGVGTCREIGQFYAALCAVRFPADGVVALVNAICRLIAVSCFYLRKIYADRYSQFQYGSGEFFSAADCLLADGNRLLCAVLHDDVIAGNAIFLRNGGSLCYLAILNGKGECSLYLVVAIRGGHFFHGIVAVRQADDIGLCIAV